MGLGDSAGILIKIKADGSQAQSELRGVAAGVLGLSDDVAGKMNPAILAGAAAFTAISAAAIGAAVGIFRLSQATAEFGSKIFDAQAKTGLSAETLSTLNINADKAGSSFESVTNSVAKFTVLLGQAENGNLKAKQTLADYNITAKDVPTALDQAIQSIGKFDNEGQRNAATMALFKDRTGAIIPVLLQMGYSLSDAEAEAKRLGQTMSQSAIEASDNFGDALTDLQSQAASVGREFALELMPSITSAMKAISDAMANNQGVAAAWGAGLLEQIRNVSAAVKLLGETFDLWLKVMTFGLVSNASAAINWSAVTTRAIQFMMGPLYDLIVRLGEAKRAYDNLFGSGDAVGSGTGKWEMGPAGKIGGKVGAGVVVPSGNVGGNGKGDAGATGPSPEEIAEKQRKEDLSKFESEQRRRLDVYRAHLAETEAALELSLSQKLIKESAFEKATGELKLKAKLFEKQLNDELLKSTLLNEEEIKDKKNEQLVLDKEIATERKKMAREVYEAIKKEVDKELADFLKAQKAKADAIKERKRLDALEDADKRASRDDAARDRNAGGLSILGDSVLSVRNDVGNLTGMISPVIPVLQLAGDLVKNLASGVGDLVQQWVLYGSVGPNAMKKMVASVLAGVSAQAAVMAVMELAYGIAALTPWGFALYGDPSKHFQSAALFGSIAVVAGVAGRAVAGNSFSQAAGGATGSGGGGGGQQQQNNFTTKFNGFGSGLNDQFQKQNMVLAQLEETQHQLARKITGMSPGDVVAIAADENPGAFRTGYESTLSDDARATDGLMRRIGGAR